MPQMTVAEAIELGLQHHQSGRLQEAETIYRQILSQHPDNDNALHLMGMLAFQVGRYDIAADLVRRAIALRPEVANYHDNFGLILEAQSQHEAAAASHRRAIEIEPREADSHCRLAIALRHLGRLDEAVAECETAVRCAPNDPGPLNNLGMMLVASGDVPGAERALRAAIALKPDYADAHVNLGAVLLLQGRFAEALPYSQRGVGLHPNFPQGHSNLGHAFFRLGRADDAIAAYQTALRLDPRSTDALNGLAEALKEVGQMDQVIARLRESLAIDPSSAATHSNLLMGLHYLPAQTPASLLEEHRRFDQQHARPLRKQIELHCNDRDPDRRIRIGYLSPDFRDHPVARFVLPLFENHRHDKYEIHAYASHLIDDATTRRLKALADGWHQIGQMSDAAAAEMIRSDRIDILVDLASHGGSNRLLIFARKPAPVQVTWLAYPGTTGIEAIDYRLSDPWLDPPGSKLDRYSEETILLPETFWCYSPYDGMPEVGPLPAAASGIVTFGSLNNFCKANEGVLQCWWRIMRQTPGSRLLLHCAAGAHRARVIESAAAAEIAADRIEFVPRVSREEYFRAYQRIDIALDTVPFNGATTTCDALWMGVPVVSQVGATAVGRGGLSLLSNLGLVELVGFDQEQYISIAVNLANDLSRLAQLRSSLRERMRGSVLMDGAKFTRNIEAAFRAMWQRWCAATPPQG